MLIIWNNRGKAPVGISASVYAKNLFIRLFIDLFSLFQMFRTIYTSDKNLFYKNDNKINLFLDSW